jgi:dTDP-4-amino-4,6-dideoxygalactose transaminase
MISKIACNSNNFRRKMLMCPSAREAFSYYLKSLQFTNSEFVLLPAYIGWSAHEGSGVFDPVEESGLQYLFYELDENLNINIKKLEKLFKENRIKLFVIIHYFGFTDPLYGPVVALAKKYGIRVIEDEAHAFFTDFVGGVSGRLGDACIFSLHKMFPVDGGGVLCLNHNEINVSVDATAHKFPYDYDWHGISQRRLENMQLIRQLLQGREDIVIALKDTINSGNIPQTFPVLIRTVSRDKLYEMMNDRGFGVVSLYHTMIKQISKEEFPGAYFVAKRIMNLPVHQDVESHNIEKMVNTLLECISKLESAS